MAKSFIYDSIGFSEATVQAGTVSGSTFTANSSAITNEHRANDQSIGSAVTSYDGTTDTIKFQFSEAKWSNVIALYFSADEANDMELYGHFFADNNMGTSIVSLTTDFDEGWNVFTYTGAYYKYLYLRALTAGSLDNLTEVIIGTKYDFDVNFDLNNKIGEEFGTDVMTSYGGQEYANKRHEPKTTWSWNWSYLSSSQKTSLDSLNSSVQDYKKFIYDDEANYHYVRMVKPLDFTEVAPSVYSTSMTLREQLA